MPPNECSEGKDCYQELNLVNTYQRAVRGTVGGQLDSEFASLTPVLEGSQIMPPPLLTGLSIIHIDDLEPTGIAIAISSIRAGCVVPIYASQVRVSQGRAIQVRVS